MMRSSDWSVTADLILDFRIWDIPRQCATLSAKVCSAGLWPLVAFV